MAAESFNPAKLLKSIVGASFEQLPQDQTSRRELTINLRKLLTQLEDPLDTINRLIFQPHQNAIIRVAIDLDLFVLVGRNEEGVTVEELQRLTGADKNLLVRVMRLLTTIGIFSQSSELRYHATPVSQAWTAPPVWGATKHLFDEAAYSLACLPDFLQETNYQNPVDNDHGPFQHAFKTDLGMWPYISERPQRLSAFNTFMEGQREGRAPWFHHFPVENSFGDESNHADAVLIVDVGGGRGHDMEAFKKAFPNQRGRLVVQDLPTTIDEIRHLTPGVETMKHDFFTPQPIKGAAAYYFRSILHDWPDDKAQIILRHTVEAMKKGHSKILINEWVLSDHENLLFPVTMDINMMALFAGMERTMGHWERLLRSEGLRISKVWGPGPEAEGLIEAVLA